MGLQSLVYYSLVSWLPAVLGDYGMTGNAPGWVLFAIQIAMLPITFVGPIIANKMKDQKIMIFLSVYLCWQVYLCLHGLSLTGSILQLYYWDCQTDYRSVFRFCFSHCVQSPVPMPLKYPNGTICWLSYSSLRTSGIW